MSEHERGPYLRARTLLLSFAAPQVSFFIQRVNEFRREFDVVAEHLLVLSDSVDVAHPASQVPVDPWSQLAVSQLSGEGVLLQCEGMKTA